MPAPLPSEVRSKRLHMGLLRTEVTGRVTAEMITQMAAQYQALVEPNAQWLIDASEAKSYAYDAIETAKNEFGRLSTERGLRTIVAIIKEPLVRMGAATVSAGMRAMKLQVQIHVVSTEAAALVALSGGSGVG